MEECSLRALMSAGNESSPVRERVIKRVVCLSVCTEREILVLEFNRNLPCRCAVDGSQVLVLFY
jgi:hypothetical protein